MKIVQPIRDRKKIELMKKVLYAENIRDYTWFTVGINSGLRISDLLDLKFENAVTDKGKIKAEMEVVEGKTGKTKLFPLGRKSIKALEEYIATIDHYEMTDPLFFSRKRNKEGQRQSISRQHAHHIISEAAEEVGLHERIGTHTLRKSFGYHAYKEGRDISIIQNMMNHSSPGVTLKYIGITKDEMDDVYINLDL